MEDDCYFKNHFHDFLAPASVLNAEKPVRGIKLFLPFEYSLLSCDDVFNEVRESMRGM